MAQYDNYTPYITGVDSLEMVNTLFRKVYQYMALGLVLTSLTAWLTASSPAMIRMFYSSQMPLIVSARQSASILPRHHFFCSDCTAYSTG